MAYNRHMRTHYRYIFIFRVWPPKFTKCTTFQTLKRKSVHTRTILRSRVWPPPNSQNYPLFQTSTRKIKYICAPSSQKHKFWFRGESRYWRNSTDFANLQRKNVCRRTSGQANTDSWFKLKFGGFFQNSRFAKNNANNLRNENEQLEHTNYFGISKIFGFTKKITATKRQKITNVKIR